MKKIFNQKINLGSRVDIKIILFYKFTLRFKQFDIILIICINDTRGTGGIFAASVVDMAANLLLILVEHLHLRIPLRLFAKG
jgi:hypothetical protein